MSYKIKIIEDRLFGLQGPLFININIASRFVDHYLKYCIKFNFGQLDI